MRTPKEVIQSLVDNMGGTFSESIQDLEHGVRLSEESLERAKTHLQIQRD